MASDINKLKNFMNSEGQLTAYPAKRKMKIEALLFLAEKFEQGKQYTEKEVNDLLSKWHNFSDPATLRRELFSYKFLERDPSGKSYWPNEKQPTREELEK